MSQKQLIVALCVVSVLLIVFIVIAVCMLRDNTEPVPLPGTDPDSTDITSRFPENTSLIIPDSTISPDTSAVQTDKPDSSASEKTTVPPVTTRPDTTTVPQITTSPSTVTTSPEITTAKPADTGSTTSTANPGQNRGSIEQKVDENGYLKLILDWEAVVTSEKEAKIKFTLRISATSISIGKRTSTLTVGTKSVSFACSEAEGSYVKGKRNDITIGSTEITVPLSNGKASLPVTLVYPYKGEFSKIKYDNITVSGIIEIQ